MDSIARYLGILTLTSIAFFTIKELAGFEVMVSVGIVIILAEGYK